MVKFGQLISRLKHENGDLLYIQMATGLKNKDISQHGHTQVKQNVQQMSVTSGWSVE